MTPPLKKCYLCNDTLNDENKSEEHIIPNCIGGRLKSWDVLCNTCNNHLGETVDSDFGNMFLSFTTCLKVAKERGDHQSIPALMTLSNGDVVEVKYIDHKAVPIRPCHIYDNKNKTVTIYGPDKVVKHYKKTVKRELSENKKSEFKIEYCDNIFGEMLFDFPLDNDALQIQLNKIASSFAIHNGVKVRDIEHIDRSQQKILSGNIVPYYPLGAMATIIEENRLHIESNYPSHTLLMFSYSFSDNRKELWCYIDLFSTFQFYSRLNKNYKGEHIWKSYQQQLLPHEILSEKDVNCSISDLDILSRQYNVDRSVPIEDMKKIILNSANNQSYELDYIEESKILMDRAMFISLQGKKTDMQKLLHLKSEFEHINYENKLYNYLRLSHLDMPDSKEPTASTYKCNEMAKAQDPELKKYGYKKFNMLQQFIMNKHIEELR